MEIPMKNLIDILDLSTEEIDQLIQTANDIIENPEKLSLVLVEGSKKRVASFFPRHFSLYFSGFSMISFAV